MLVASTIATTRGPLGMVGRPLVIASPKGAAGLDEDFVSVGELLSFEQVLELGLAGRDRLLVDAVVELDAELVLFRTRRFDCDSSNFCLFDQSQVLTDMHSKHFRERSR
jgi:hypothetical protein